MFCYTYEIKYILSNILLQIVSLKTKMHTLHQCISGFESQPWYTGQPKHVTWGSLAFCPNRKQQNKSQTWKNKNQEFLGPLTVKLFLLLKDLIISIFSNQGLLEPCAFVFPTTASGRFELMFLWLSHANFCISILSFKLFLSFIFIPHCY